MLHIMSPKDQRILLATTLPQCSISTRTYPLLPTSSAVDLSTKPAKDSGSARDSGQQDRPRDAGGQGRVPLMPPSHNGSGPGQLYLPQTNPKRSGGLATTRDSLTLLDSTRGSSCGGGDRDRHADSYIGLGAGTVPTSFPSSPTSSEGGPTPRRNAMPYNALPQFVEPRAEPDEDHSGSSR